MDGMPQVLTVVAMIVLPFGFIVNWWSTRQTYRRDRCLLLYEPRDCVGWGLLDMGLYVVVLAAVVGMGTKLATNRLGISDASELESLAPEDQAIIMLAFGVSTIITTVLCLGWNWSRFERVEGFDLNEIGEDIQLGFRWFTMLVLPVLLLQFILNQWFPTEHPIIEMLQSSGDTSLLPVAAFVAVVSAPIFEECFFRLFLQGWLEKLHLTRMRTNLGLATQADRDAVLLGGQSSSKLVDSDAEDSARKMPILWIPILFSSALFALAHWSHGPDWVALFVLAIGLGYLYQRTGRIVPCMTVHFLVNGLGMIQLWAAVTMPQ